MKEIDRDEMNWICCDFFAKFGGMYDDRVRPHTSVSEILQWVRVQINEQLNKILQEKPTAKTDEFGNVERLWLKPQMKVWYGWKNIAEYVYKYEEGGINYIKDYCLVNDITEYEIEPVNTDRFKYMELDEKLLKIKNES